MPTAVFEPSISGSEQLQTYALDRAATGIGTDLHCDYHSAPMAQQPLLSQGLLNSEGSRSHSARHTTLGRTLLDE